MHALDAETIDDPGPPTGPRVHANTPVEFLPAGTTLLNKFEIIRELARGGMGVVYLARDKQLGRNVAVKILDSRDPALAKRFRAEAEATARFTHENIVTIHHFGEFNGIPFMVLEYLRGRTLTRELGGKPISPGRAVQLIVPVVRALVCAHDGGIIHRDLKPDNIFVTETGMVKVLDFGIAKILSESRARTLGRLRRTAEVSEISALDRGLLLGTLPYMAPEQWRGHHSDVDHRTDIWAVGIILYEMLTGLHPLTPRSGQQLMVIGVEHVPMPSIRSAGVDVADELADIVDHCLAKPKNRRFASARELLDALTPLSPARLCGQQATDDNPYPGLVAFSERDAGRFFGRRQDVAYLTSCLQTRPLVGVVGPSGVGKSSLVRAGVVPALEGNGDNWTILTIRPGRDPLTALAGALLSLLYEQTSPSERYETTGLASRLMAEPGYAGSLLREFARARGCRVLLFVDQFEELYTLVHRSDERMGYTNCLSGIADDASTPLRVVISVRSDFLHRAAENRWFVTQLTPGLVFLLPPDRDGIREALVRPAEMHGYRFETERMIEHLIDTLASTPGALPLLQFAATKLWDTRDRVRKLLTERRYRELGGVGGALATHADELVGALHPRDQTLVQALFLRLVTAERTRAIGLLSELRELTPNPHDIDRLVDYLASGRLLVVQSSDEHSAEASVEIVHEALIISWPQLAHWLDEHQDDAVFLEQLRTTAKQWQAKRYPPGMLWRGQAERDARNWRHRYRGPLGQLERQYLHAVFAAADRNARHKRLALIGSFAFLIALIMGTLLTIVVIDDAKDEATRQAQMARLAERKARDAEAAAKAAAQAARDELHKRKQAEQEKAAVKTELKTANKTRLQEKRRHQRVEAKSRKAQRRAEEQKRKRDTKQTRCRYGQCK